MTTFGTHLKSWRSTRRLSQLDLAGDANVSSRHISFLESGRSQPSRPMVLHLCDILEIPKSQRNAMLQSVAIYVVALFVLVPAFGNHGLWAALMVLNLARGVTMGWRCPKLEAQVA